jgi:mandelamide amidase
MALPTDMTQSPDTATQLVSALATGRLRLQDLVEGLLARAHEMRHLNAFLDLDEAAIRESAAAPHSGPLHGLPLAIKANIDAEGAITSAGTPALRAWRARADAAVVARLRRAGALPFGRANLHELALGSTSNNLTYGPVRNPWDPLRVAGGSSGGTAAAVAAGLVPVGLGTDTAGSCRIPAALCGCVGFRPSLGRYPTAGLVPMTRRRDTIGPLARTVGDIDLIDRLVDPSRAALTGIGLRGRRLGVPRMAFWQGLDPRTEAVLDASLDLLRAEGAVLIDIDLDVPEPEERDRRTLVTCLVDMPVELQAYLDTNHTGLSAHDVFAAMDNVPERRLLLAQYGPDAVPPEAAEALLGLRAAAQAALFGVMVSAGIEALLMPATILPACLISEGNNTLLNGQSVSTMTGYIRTTDYAASLQLPSITVPAGLTEDGLPVGLMFDGLAGSDALLLDLAAAFEAARGPMPAPPPATDWGTAV